MAKKEKEKQAKEHRAVIAADLHMLKKPGMWAGRAEIAGDDIFAFQQIVEHCILREADLYLLGDVFDSVSNLPRPLIAVFDLLGRLVEKGLKVFYLQGQHEMVQTMPGGNNRPWMSMFAPAQHLHGHAFDFLGHKAYGLDYFPQAFEALQLSSVPNDTVVLFLHGTIDIVMPLGFHITSRLIPPSVRYVFAGDWHEYKELNLEQAIMVYPGSTYLNAANEPDKKYILEVSASKGKLVWTPIQLKTRPIYRVSNLNFDALDIKDDTSLPKELQHPVIIVDRPIEPDQYAVLVQYGYLYTTQSANPHVPSTQEIAEVEKMSDAEILSKYVDREKHPEEFEFILDVIQNPVPDTVVRLRERLGVQLDADIPVQPDKIVNV